MHTLWHLIGPLLDAAQARNVLEIGTGDGALTRLLLARAAQCGGIIHSVDIETSAEVRLLQEQSGSSFTFHHGSSLDVIPRITGIDAVLIDGDHNWYTVYHELLLIEKHLEHVPLVLLHDIGWPYGRRDLYYNPDAIPEEGRHSSANRGILPFSEQLSASIGLNRDLHNALMEGGPRNGVRTAIEDFIARSKWPMRFVAVPGLYGLGIIVDGDLLARRPALATFLDVLASPVLAEHCEALETKRVLLKQRIAEKDQRIAEKDQRIAEKDQRIAEKDQRIAAVSDELRHIFATRSWRWMAPFRHAEAFLTRSLIRLRALLARALRMGRLQASPTCAPSAIDIVLPTFNNAAATLRCLAALRCHTTAFRVIWVDNGSSRADHAAVSAALAYIPHIALRTPHRLGFIKATNIGMAVATSDVVVLLNNDTEVTDGWLRSLLSTLAADPAIGIVGPVTDTPHSWQGRVAAGKGYYIVPGMVAFFCVAIRRDVIRRIGYLSEEFGEGFGDDDDYCARARAAGWKVALALGSFVRHAHRTTFRSLYAPETIRTMQECAMQLFHKRHPPEDRTAAARISVVVPLRIPWAATQKLWESLEQQTVPFELLLEDGRGGAAAARNRGARRAGGEFLFFCDQDVELVPLCLGTLLDALVAHPDVGYAYCDYDRRGALTGQHIAASFDADVLRQCNYISTMSLLRRCLFPGFDETLERFQDWDLWLTLLERGITGTYVPRALFTAYYRPGDISTVAATEETWRQRALRKHGIPPPEESALPPSASVRSRNDSPVILPDSMVTTLSQMRSNFSRE